MYIVPYLFSIAEKYKNIVAAWRRFAYTFVHVWFLAPLKFIRAGRNIKISLNKLSALSKNSYIHDLQLAVIITVLRVKIFVNKISFYQTLKYIFC